jgi:hypothetical protein
MLTAAAMPPPLGAPGESIAAILALWQGCFDNGRPCRRLRNFGEHPRSVIQIARLPRRRN